MLIYIFIALLLALFVVLVRDLNSVPETKDEEYDDPTTTFWHDDDHHHPNESF